MLVQARISLQGFSLGFRQKDFLDDLHDIARAKSV